MGKALGWDKILKDQILSGQSGRRFCNEHGIKYHSFRYQKKKATLLQENRQGNFLPVEIIPTQNPQPTASIEVIRKDGVRILIHTGFNEALLKALIKC